MHKTLFLGAWLFSQATFAFDATFSGSASVDYRFVSGEAPTQNPSTLGINGLTLEVAQKISADVTNNVSFSVKVCGGCHGLEVDQAYGELHIRRAFNLRAGRLNVPLGEFSVRHDPTNFSTPSKPLPYAMGDMLHYGREGLNLGIVPAPWVDNGVEVFGSVSLTNTLQLDYSVYAIKGLAGDNDLDFAESRSYVDNNRTPSVGARLVLTGDDWALGTSGVAGTYDAKDSLWYQIGGLDAYWRSGPVTLRAEVLMRRTDLDPTATGYPFVLKDPWFLKLGWFFQADVELHETLSVIVRADQVRRFGMPLPATDLNSTSAGVVRATAAVLWKPLNHFAAKLDYELWSFSGVDYPTAHMVRFGIVVGY